jgi:hypothetical protein
MNTKQPLKAVQKYLWTVVRQKVLCFDIAMKERDIKSPGIPAVAGEAYLLVLLE